MSKVPRWTMGNAEYEGPHAALETSGSHGFPWGPGIISKATRRTGWIDKALPGSILIWSNHGLSPLRITAVFAMRNRGRPLVLSG